VSGGLDDPYTDPGGDEREASPMMAWGTMAKSV